MKSLALPCPAANITDVTGICSRDDGLAVYARGARASPYVAYRHEMTVRKEEYVMKQSCLQTARGGTRLMMP